VAVRRYLAVALVLLATAAFVVAATATRGNRPRPTLVAETYVAAPRTAS
jgi:hypothetical protein